MGLRGPLLQNRAHGFALHFLLSNSLISIYFMMIFLVNGHDQYKPLMTVNAQAQTCRRDIVANDTYTTCTHYRFFMSFRVPADFLFYGAG